MPRSRYEHEILGRRPAKFSFGEAFGIAMQGAGQYYGEVGVEKRKAEARAAAKEAKIEERDEQREFDQEKLEEQREFDESQGSVTDTIVINGEARIVRMNKNGDIIKDLGKDPDFTVDEDGNVVKLSAGGKGASENNLKESEMKFRLHARTMNAARKQVERLLGEGYDLTSLSAAGDRIAQSIPLGNFLQSDKGQQFTVATGRLAESLFKGESGAAGSDAEAARYRSFIPQAGDREETIRMKLEILDATEAAFAEAGKIGMSVDDAVIHARKVATVEALERGFEESKEGFKVPGSAAGPNLSN